MLACDWKGHSYSASTIFAAPAMAASASPCFTGSWRAIGVAARMWSYSAALPGNGGTASDHVTFSARAARMASHSRGAATPRKPCFQTTRAPGMSPIDASSTAVGTLPVTAGRIMRACSMPGRRMSVTNWCRAKTFSGMSVRGTEVPTTR